MAKAAVLEESLDLALVEQVDLKAVKLQILKELLCLSVKPFVSKRVDRIEECHKRLNAITRYENEIGGVTPVPL